MRNKKDNTIDDATVVLKLVSKVDMVHDCGHPMPSIVMARLHELLKYPFQAPSLGAYEVNRSVLALKTDLF